MKFKYTLQKTCKLSIQDKQLARFMEPYGVGAINKKMPEWVWSLNKNQCRILFCKVCY